MTTAREVCTRALRRCNIVDALSTPSAEDMQTALDMLNEMLDGWPMNGVEVLKQADYALGDTFGYWVPPLDLESSSIDVLAYQGEWDANANSPALSSSSGTEGYVYKVSTAGNTTLDDVTSWALGDYAVFDGSVWLKSISSQRFVSGNIAMLAVRLASEEYHVDLPAEVVRMAQTTWSSMLPYYCKPPTATFDKAIRAVPSRSIAVTWEGQ